MAERFSKTYFYERVLRVLNSCEKEFRATEGEAHQRAWGGIQAMEWLVAGFNLDGNPHPNHLARFLDAAGKVEKVNRKTAAKLILLKIYEIEKRCNFTQHQTGWAQVDGKGSYLNRNYGWWDELSELFIDLDLHDVAVPLPRSA